MVGFITVSTQSSCILLVVANVAVKFGRTESDCRPTSRDHTFISLSGKLKRIQIDTSYIASTWRSKRCAPRLTREHRGIALLTRVAVAATDRQRGPATGIYRPVTNVKSVDRFLARRTVPQLVRKLPVVYGTRRFITVLSTARRLFLPWTKRIQFTFPHPVALRSILKLHCHLPLSRVSGSFRGRIQTKPCMYFSSPHLPHATTISTSFVWSPE